MGIIIDIIAVIIFNFIHCAYTEHILACNVNQLNNSCPGINHICNATTQQCGCIAGYVSDGDDCVPIPSDVTNNDATAAVISIFTIAFVIVGLVLVIRKYNVIEYIRHKINMRRNDIIYEDVMIGQDDPPLIP